MRFSVITLIMNAISGLISKDLYHRKIYKEITANPLAFSKEEKGRKDQD